MRLRRILWNPCKEYTRTGHPDTPSEGIWTTYPGRNCTRLPPFCTRLPLFTPGCAPPFLYPATAICTRLPRTFHPDVHIRNSVARWERRRFQLLRTDIFGSSNSVYPDGRAAILHSVVAFSWSFLIFATDILGYFEIFCFRYLLSKSPKSPCNPPMIGFLSY